VKNTMFAMVLLGVTLHAQPRVVPKDNPTYVGPTQAAPAALQKIFSNLGPSTSAYDNTGWLLDGPDYCGNPGSCYYDQLGMAFTPAANATVKQVWAAVQYSGSISGVNQIDLSLYSDNGGVPGTLLAGPLTVTNLPQSPSCCTLAIANFSPGVAITAGVQYWVVAATPLTGTGSDFAGWWMFVPPPKNAGTYGSNADGSGWYHETAFNSEPAGAVYGTIQ
jgi:hypothetical protein